MPADKQRNASGRFAEGNAGGPGRPRRAVEADYLHVVADACSLKDWREIVDAAVRNAKTGDPRARAWLGAYMMGSPQTAAPTLLTVEAQALAGVDTVQRSAERERQHDKLAQMDKVLGGL